MSAVMETAQLEAAIAENELTDEQAGRLRELLEEGKTLDEALVDVLHPVEPGPTPPAPTPAAEPLAAEPSDKQLRQLDTQTQRHQAKVREIMGHFVADFEECAHCAGYGLAPPGPEPQSHRFFKTCETCLGFGQVKTGSLREEHVARDCPRCKGRGYLEAIGADGTPLVDGGEGSPAPVTTPAGADAQQPQPASPAGAGELTFGTPAWMGDTTIGQ